MFLTDFNNSTCNFAPHPVPLLPQIDYMVLVVSSVEVDVTWIDEQERKQDDEDLDGVFPSVNKVSIKHIGLLQGWHVVLEKQQVK